MRPVRPADNLLLHAVIAVLVGLCIMVDRSILYLDGFWYAAYRHLDGLGRYGIRIDLTLRTMLIGGAVTLAYAVSAGLPRLRYATGAAFVVYLMATWAVIKQTDLRGVQLAVFGVTKLGEAWFVASVAATVLYSLSKPPEPPVSSDAPPRLHLVP